MLAYRRIKIVEVGARDGLQNEKALVSTPDKLKLIRLLADAGLNHIEVTAFVSPKWVPQMADHAEIMARATKRSGLVRSVLVPNEKGAIAAIAAGADELAVFTSASESFAARNINCTIAESLERFIPVIALARRSNIPVRGYVSCAVECPFEGAIAPEAARFVSARLIDIGCYEIAVADTIGRATPNGVNRMLLQVLTSVPAARLACHFHDTSGQALDNVDVALEKDVRTFDSAAGGLGGCPYAPGAAGNLATGTLIAHLERQGFSTNVDQAKLHRAERYAMNLRR